MRFTNLLNRFLGSPGGAQRRQQPRQNTIRPRLEALEDRLVLSTVTLSGTTLNIGATPNDTILLRDDPATPGTLDVSDTAGLLGKFATSSFNTVKVSVTGNDAIKVDDSNGGPFATGTLMTLDGSGAKNSLALIGSLPNPTGGETFTAGRAGLPGDLGTGIGEFTFSSAISSVTDDLIDTGQLLVKAPGQAVTLAGPNGQTETLNGLAGAGGGGNSLTFRGKTSVRLELDSPNAVASLNANQADAKLKFFLVDAFGNQDTVNINATPNLVQTNVEMSGGAQNDSVNLRGNFGPVTINGDSTTVVALGTNNTDSSQSVTSGIRNNVFVEGAEALQILDGGNAATQENMKVTESTISGTGMFGSNSVVVTYEGDTDLEIETGRLANTYTVAGSHPGAGFVSFVSINDDFSNAGLSVHVNVDGGSGLALGLFNQDPANGSLLISAPFGTFNPPLGSVPNGNTDISFAGGLSSTVVYEGFDSVGALPVPIR
jgi:hypothetical protein